MTPDHTPYLVEGDLRTPQDVAAWLDGEIRDAIEGRAMLAPSTSFGPPVRGSDADAVSIRSLQYAHKLLTERLDRERRQACRRGQSKWTRAMLRAKSSEKEYLAKIYKDFPGGPPTGKVLRDHMRNIREARWGYCLDMALAIRAAARAR